LTNQVTALASRRMRSGVLAVAAVLLAAPVLAGDVYRWTDASGVVHFADVPPPNVRALQMQSMPAATPRPAAAAAPAADSAQPEAAKGAARVVLTRQDEAGLGEARHGFSGAVKNEGGAPAHAVAVAIRVVEPNQGDECMTDEIAVEPSTLAPGESGRFSADFDNPCFRGATQTAFEVVWD
jgi:hypothetical protein